MIVALARRDIIGAVAVVAAVYQRAPEHMAVLVRELPVPRRSPLPAWTGSVPLLESWRIDRSSGANQWSGQGPEASKRAGCLRSLE